MLAANQVVKEGKQYTVFRSLGGLELVRDFVFPHVCGLWNECLGRKGSFVEARGVKLMINWTNNV